MEEADSKSLSDVLLKAVFPSVTWGSGAVSAILLGEAMKILDCMKS